MNKCLMGLQIVIIGEYRNYLSIKSGHGWPRWSLKCLSVESETRHDVLWAIYQF